MTPLLAHPAALNDGGAPPTNVEGGRGLSRRDRHALDCIREIDDLVWIEVHRKTVTFGVRDARARFAELLDRVYEVPKRRKGRDCNAPVGGGGVTVGAKGRSLELFFIDGKPDAMLTAEVFNWTGHVLMTPRTQISEALKRKEARYTGIYLLIGEKDGTPLTYIGEAEDISDRIRNHDSKRDWWNTAILVTSAANNLNKAHVKYLESRLIEEARAVGKIALENVTTPARPGLSEAAQANMEAFIDYVLMVLPALRIDSFLKNTRPASQPADRIDSGKAPLFELQTPKHGISATAKLENGELVVQAGSSARLAWEGRGSENTAYGQLHAELVRMGILVEQGTQRVFNENYAFKSPSAAAAVVNGRPANGTIEWKVPGQNKTYKQWEAEKLARDNADRSA